MDADALDEKKTMRVLCITDHSDRPEMETIIGLKHLGVDIYVLCPTTGLHYNRYVQAGIPVTELVLKSRIEMGAIRLIRRLIVEKKIDILHLFTNRAISNGILASRKIPVKIVTYRGTAGNVSYFNPGSWTTFLHPRVDRIICVSEAVRQFFLHLNFLWHHFPAEKPVTIYKGHDLSWYQEQPGSLKQFGIPDDAFVAACTGRHRPHKGIPVLIDAMRYIPREFPIHLLLIGPLDESVLIKKVNNSPQKDRIHMVGYRTNAPALQAACDVAVLPALRREGLPKVIIEAMAYGIPPIVTNTGGSPELVENNISGIVVQPGQPQEIAQAIIRLYKDPAFRRAMGEKARIRIANCFRIEDTIAQTLLVYKSCLTSI